MAYDQRHFDFGLRGRDQFARRGGPGGRFGGGERRAEPRTPRVTARYNRDYVAYDRDVGFGGRGRNEYPQNFNMFTGDRPEQIGDFRYMRRPYSTIGGTRTFRGATDAMGYGRDFDVYDREFRRS